MMYCIDDNGKWKIRISWDVNMFIKLTLVIHQTYLLYLNVDIKKDWKSLPDVLMPAAWVMRAWSGLNKAGPRRVLVFRCSAHLRFVRASIESPDKILCWKLLLARYERWARHHPVVRIKGNYSRLISEGELELQSRNSSEHLYPIFSRALSKL